MITTIKLAANTSNTGTLAASARLKLMESVVMPSILYGVEAYPNITKKEMDRLERIQCKILRELFGMPPSTSYMAMLMETGTLTMEAKMNYKRLMIYHNILNSDEKRLVKKVIEQQILRERGNMVQWSERSYSKVWNSKRSNSIKIGVEERGEREYQAEDRGVCQGGM